MVVACGTNAQGYSVDDIIELAMKIEQAGIKFYSSLAIQEVITPVRDLFVYLAEEEKSHLTSFNLLKGLLIDEGLNTCSGEYLEYLNAIINAHIVFQQDPDDLERINTVREALDLAIRFERDSIMVFNELLSLVGKRGQEAIGNLIFQEQVHIRRLANQYNLI